MNVVNVVIPNYNGGDMLNRCIDSVLRDSYPDKLITVIDNFSDITPSIKGISIVRNDKNYGFAYACNRGIRDGATYTLFLNNDCEVQGDAIKKMVEVLDYHSHVAAVCPVITSGDNYYYCGGQIGGFGRVYHNKHVLSDMPYFTGYLTGAAMMIRTDLYRNFKFNERYFMYYEDVELSLRLKRAGWTLLVVPSAIIKHAVGSSTVGWQRYKMIWKSGLIFIRNYSIIKRPLAWLFMLEIPFRFVYRRIMKWK